MKAVVSHRERGRFSIEEIKRRIQQKDDLARIHFEQRYGFDLFSDRSPFDMILDISSCISEPTLRASLQSISQVHNLLRPAVGWYLTRDPSFKYQFQEARVSSPNLVARCPDSLLDPEQAITPLALSSSYPEASITMNRSVQLDASQIADLSATC